MVRQTKLLLLLLTIIQTNLVLVVDQTMTVAAVLDKGRAENKNGQSKHFVHCNSSIAAAELFVLASLHTRRLQDPLYPLYGTRLVAQRVVSQPVI